MVLSHPITWSFIVDFKFVLLVYFEVVGTEYILVVVGFSWCVFLFCVFLGGCLYGWFFL